MTTLCELIMECRAIGIDDRVVLYGWAAQLEEGRDTVYASKETVAEFLTPTSLSTLQRRTKRLVKLGLMVETGERKQWRFGWTPVYSINVPMIVELCEAQPVKLTGGVKMTACQNDLQGSRFRFTSFFSSSSAAEYESKSSDQQPTRKSKEGGQTENREPRTVEPKPAPHGQRKSCPDCGEPLQRDVNHFLECKTAKGRSELDEFLGDMPPRPSKDSMGELMDFDDDDDYDDTPLFPFGQTPNGEKAEGAKQRVDTVGQKPVPSNMAEGRATATPTTSHGRPPVAPAPPRAKRCQGCGGREPCRDKWCYAYEPLPKSVDENRPTGTNP